MGINFAKSLADDNRPMTRKLLLDAAILLALAVLAVAGYKLAPLLSPRTDVVLPLSPCNIGERQCLAQLPDGSSIEFSIEPRPIPSLKPLHLSARAKGGDIRRIEVDFAGTDMKMGYNRPVLVRSGDGFTGQATLPVCITGKMEWDVMLLVETATALVAVPFRFETNNE